MSKKSLMVTLVFSVVILFFIIRIKEDIIYDLRNGTTSHELSCLGIKLKNTVSYQTESAILIMKHRLEKWPKSERKIRVNYRTFGITGVTYLTDPQKDRYHEFNKISANPLLKESEKVEFVRKGIQLYDERQDEALSCLIATYNRLLEQRKQRFERKRQEKVGK